jgi:hemolysin activation/secretion protein
MAAKNVRPSGAVEQFVSMKKLSLLIAGLMLSGLCAAAQGVDQLAPSDVTPKAPVKPEGAPAIPELPKSPRSPAGDKPINPDQPNLTIKAVIIVKTSAEIQDAGVPATNGVIVHDIPFLSGPDFQKVVAPFLGRTLTENAIRDVQDAIILYCRNRGKLLVDVVLPEQSIDNGVLQLWFLEGRVGQIDVNNPGKKWFKDKLIRRDIRLQPGDPVDSDKLTDDLNWVNANPFRQVDVSFKPGTKLELTDVELNVNDRIPLRPYVGYEDSGTRFTGEDRFLAGFNWGNVFGLDQQLNYQYATDAKFDLVHANAASYLIPLPWRHTLMFYGSYVQGRADFSSIGNPTSSEGRSWQTSVRYSIPLRHIMNYRHEISAGFDFKESNNSLQAGGNVVLQNSDTDIAQYVAEYSGLVPDRFGQTSVGAEFYYSPGHMTPDNTDTAFNLLRTDAKASYMYARLNLERDTALPVGFTWILKGWYQASNQRLLPSEEFALGGYSTIRGYDERVISGDDGWVVNNELRTPPFSLLNFVRIHDMPDQLQFLGFFDCGAESVIDANPSDGTDPNKTLYSIGAGLRYTIAANFSLRFDYGFPLTQKDLNQYSSRAHFGVLLSF